MFERKNVRAVRPELLDRLHRNDPRLADELLQDPVVRRRNRIALDWDGAWRLDTGARDHPEDAAVDVAVRFAAPIPVRPVRLIAEGLDLSRAEVERLVAEGCLLSRVNLRGKRSGDFSFTLERWGPRATAARVRESLSWCSRPAVGRRPRRLEQGPGAARYGGPAFQADGTGSSDKRRT